MMKKLVIIPAFNESACILKTVQNIKEHTKEFDYIVIDDHSTDETALLCEKNAVPVLKLPTNLGIGGAVQTGYRYAMENNYDIAVQFDGDGQHNAAFLEKMATTLINENVDMVIGSRFIEKEGFQSSGMRRVGIRFLSGLTKVLTGKKITDPTSGLRMISKEVIELFASDYPKDYPEPESNVLLLRSGKKIIEIPVIMQARETGKSSISPRKSIYYMIKVSLAMIIAGIRRKR